MKIEKSNLHLIVFLIFVLLYGIYQFVQYRNIASNGLITLGKVTKFEGFKSGIRTYIDVYYNSNVINTSTRQIDLEKISIGKWILVKIQPDDIDKIVVSSYDLPSCIDTVNIPKKGWRQLPECK